MHGAPALIVPRCVASALRRAHAVALGMSLCLHARQPPPRSRPLARWLCVATPGGHGITGSTSLLSFIVKRDYVIDVDAIINESDVKPALVISFGYGGMTLLVSFVELVFGPWPTRFCLEPRPVGQHNDTVQSAADEDVDKFYLALSDNVNTMNLRAKFGLSNANQTPRRCVLECARRHGAWIVAHWGTPACTHGTAQPALWTWLLHLAAVAQSNMCAV